MRLKDRNRGLPGSFQLLLPETGMKSPIKGSFSSVVQAFSKIVSKNPALAHKHGWPTNLVDQENWIDQRQCHRLIAAGYSKFVEIDGVSPPYVGGMRRSSHGGVAAAAKAVVAGVGLWIDLFGPEGKVVDKQEAERRAATCVVCPLNDTKTSLKTLFIEKAAATILKQYAMLHDMNLHTSRDSELGVCTGCLCANKSKVWVDMTHIKAHMIAEVEAKLDPSCWIKNA